MRACKKSAPYDPIWPRLAPFGPFGHVSLRRLFLALFGPVWPRVAPFDPVWHHLAPFGPIWPHLALIGHSSISISRYFKWIYYLFYPIFLIFPIFPSISTLSMLPILPIFLIFLRIHLFPISQLYVTINDHTSFMTIHDHYHPWPCMQNTPMHNAITWP